MSKSPEVSPFGPNLQRYWDQRYAFFSKFDEGIEIDEEGLYSVVPEAVALHHAELISGQSVLDGFGGVGGVSIALARADKRVICVEINSARLAMARHNSMVYGVAEKVTFIMGDFFDVAPQITADAVYLDPPWGGPSYKELGRFLLENFDPDGNKILSLSLDHFNEVIFKLPTIFDFSEFDRFDVDYQVIDDISDGRVISKTAILHKRSEK